MPYGCASCPLMQHNQQLKRGESRGVQPNHQSPFISHRQGAMLRLHRFCLRAGAMLSPTISHQSSVNHQGAMLRLHRFCLRAVVNSFSTINHRMPTVCWLQATVPILLRQQSGRAQLQQISYLLLLRRARDLLPLCTPD